MTEPAGSMNLSVKYFRDMLAATPAFLTWTGESTESSALERIHYEGLPGPIDNKAYTKFELQSYRPFAIVYIADEAGFSRSITSTTTFDEVGSIVLSLEQDAPSSLGDDPSSDANIQWSNTIGAIIDGLADLRAAAAAGHLMFNDIHLLARGWANKDKVATQGLFQSALLAVNYSSGQSAS